MLNYQIKWKNDSLRKEYENFLNMQMDVLSAVLSGEEEYQEHLGWMDIDEWSNNERIQKIQQYANKIQKNSEVFVLIGVGGSNNAARSVITALKKKDTPQIIYSGNTLSPHAIHRVLEQLENKSVHIHCIAKNFETLEPGSSFRVLRQYLEKRYGQEANQRISVSGTIDSSLHELSKQEQYQFFAFPTNVGGRFTSLTSVGLLPMAVAGIDIESLVLAAKNTKDHLFKQISFQNIALKYAVLRNFLYQKGYQIELLSSFEPQFKDFFRWWWQLFGESEGKENKGIYPSYAEYSEDLHSIGQYVQEGLPIIFETLLTIKQANSALMVQPDDKLDYFNYLDHQDFWQINRIASEATIAAHLEKIPACSIITLDKMNEAAFGELFYFFQLSCYLSCKIMGVNPFNQPGVESYKNRMFKELRRK